MTHKIQILHLIKSLGRGGAEMLLPETLNFHDKEKFNFHYIYFLPWKNQMVEALEQNGVRVTCFDSNNNIQLLFKVFKIVKYVKKNNISLIHAHLPWAGIVGRLVGKLSGVPVIYTEHNIQERYHLLTRLVNLATMNWLTKIIAVSKDVESSIRRSKSSLKVPIQTILNGVNTDRFNRNFFNGEEVRKTFRIPMTAPIVGTVAVFRFQKRLDLWMEVAAEVLKTVPEAYFIIVGDGPLKRDLIQKCKLLKLEDRIHFAGLQTDVRPYLAAFDIFMISSVFEGLPVALLEAMSMGLPVVSTDAGGIREVINDLNIGILVPVDQWNRLAEEVNSLLKSNQRRKHLAEASRHRVEQLFSMKKMVSELEANYLSTLGIT